VKFKPEEIIIFLGPSLPLHEAQAILDARYFPPARQGDIVSMAVQFKPKVIGLIDGYFMQTLSVWHKEILYALDQGVIILGASSMGALRAAETAPYGMIGVGEIFKLYESGEVEDDDEVVLIHGPQEEGYPPFSIPLINLRITLKMLAGQKKLSQEVCTAFFEIARALYYPERTFERISENALKKGLSKELVSHAMQCIEENYIDQKKEDAKLLLERIKTLIPTKKVKVNDPARTPLFDIYYQSDRRLYSPETDQSITPAKIAHYTALHHPDFSQMQFHALNQALVSLLARILEIEVSAEEIEKEAERFVFRCKLRSNEREEWLRCNHLTEEEFSCMIQERAKARALHRYFTASQMPWKQTKALLEELKCSNQYSEWADKALAQEQLLNEAAPAFLESDAAELYDDEIVEQHLKESQWKPDLYYKEWAHEAGFIDEQQMKLEMLKAKVTRDYLEKLIFPSSSV
jgi:hypothetical protein